MSFSLRVLIRLSSVVLLILIFLTLSPCKSALSITTIRCASTTSTQNSGLFDYLLPLFERKTGIRVHVIAVGTGAALELGKRGDVDVVFVHSKEDEIRLLKEGWFVNRFDIMYNDFIIVGPVGDPAGIKGFSSAKEAFMTVARGGFLFVSRGDNSGTHKKEMKIWKQTGIKPEGKKWYLQVGQGMAKTLRIAAQKGAYTLTDRGTFLSMIDREALKLEVMVEGDPILFNQYGVMAVNPKRHPHIKYTEAMKFIEWLVSEEGQNAIASFRDSHGNQLFHPNAKR